jgi:hypothetical protein
MEQDHPGNLFGKASVDPVVWCSYDAVTVVEAIPQASCPKINLGSERQRTDSEMHTSPPTRSLNQ